MMIDRTELIEFGGGGGSSSGSMNGGGGGPGTSSCMDNPENNVNKAEYYIQQLNSSNAKKVALCLVLGFICYHGLIHLRYGELITVRFIYCFCEIRHFVDMILFILF